MNKISILCIIFYIIVFMGCGFEKTKEIKTYPPLLNMEIINVPSVGIVEWLNGVVLLKKKDLNKYCKVSPKDIINFEDILELKKGSSIKIIFKDGSYLFVDTVKKNSWLVLEKKP